MNFQDKFRYLMDLTATKNKQIAEAINVDPSVISRLRNGKRRIPKNAEYKKLIADYFAEHITSNFQRDAIREVTGRNNIDFCNKIEVSLIIKIWIMNEESTNEVKLAEPIHTGDNEPIYIIPEKDNIDIKSMQNNNQVFVFYGDEGKKRACLLFENIILALGKVCDINILTEGNTEWLWKDREYANLVSENIKKAVLDGCSIKRIHPRNQNLSFAFDTAKRWIPLFMTGKVASYFYPFIRDNVFNRTLYVASGIAALISTTVGEKNKSCLTYLTTNPDMVACYAQEFYNYFEFCKPVTTVYSYIISATSLINCINNFFERMADCISINEGLSYISAPKKLIEIPSEQKNDRIEILIIEHTLRVAQLEKLLKEHSFTEMFCLDSYDDIISGNVSFLPFSGYQSEPLIYTPDLYVLHLKNIVYMLNKYPNYNVVLLNHKVFDSNIIIKEGYSVLAISHKEPLTVTEVEYEDIVTALWEYVKSKTKVSPKMYVITRIKNYISQLEDYIASQH